MNKTRVAGIDEVGRGPLAGPLVVGLVSNIDIRKLRGIKDSKKLSRSQREKWNRIIRKNGVCRYASVNNSFIDKYGIQAALKKCISGVLGRSSSGYKMVILDGGLKAPIKYKQRTIIRGDEKNPLIAAASIVAKVARDNMMVIYSSKYPNYEFSKHKGYGTKKHIKALRKYGPCEIHRRSFLRNLINKR